MDLPPSLETLLVEHTVDAVVYADAEGAIRVWNAAAAALFGVPASAALGASLDLIVPERLRAAHWKGYRAAIASGQTRLGGRPTVTRASHPSGRPLFVEMSFSLVKDGAGRVLGSVAIARDVTAQRLAARPPGDAPPAPAVEPPATEAGLRQRLAAGCAQLARLGLVSGSAGNVSCRFDGGALITPTGASADALDAAAIVSIDLDGNTRGPGIPSSEWSMHAEIYRRYPQAQAIVHTHSDACVALACQRRAIPAFHYMIATFGGDDVRCAPYATFGTEALARAAADALADRSACLLANHGMIGWGADIERALATATRLETLARQYIMALQAGAPVLLDAAEMRVVLERYRSYGSARLPTR